MAKESSGARFYAKTIELDLRALSTATNLVLTEKLARNLKRLAIAASHERSAGHKCRGSK